MRVLIEDLRHGLRIMAKAPTVAVLIVITLSLGIGASTMVFNVVRQWVWNAVAFPQSDRIAVLWEIDTKKGWQGSASAPDFLDWRDQNQVFENISAWTSWNFNLTGKDRAERIRGARVSANLFQTLEAQPAMGRTFLPEEERAGAGHVAILSYGLWHDRFNGSPSLTGNSITLDGETYTVVGIMPEGFHLPLMGRANIWVPLVFTEKERTDRMDGWLNVLARLKPGVTFPQAQQAMNPIAQRLEKLYPESNTNSGIFINTLTREVGKHVGAQAVYVGFLTGVCILMIACANVAGILLARALARQKEMAVRISLGASRFRLVRQLLTENIMLFLIASFIGTVIAAWGGDWITSAIPFENRGYLPNYGRIYVDFGTLGFALGAAFISSVLFGLAPALQGSDPNLTGTLKDVGGSVSVSLRGRRMRKILIVAEVALALMTLVPAGLLAKSLKHMYSADLGFRPGGLMTARLDLPSSKYVDLTHSADFYDQLLGRLHGLPQVTNAAVSQSIPFGESDSSAELYFEGRPAPAPGSVPFTQISAVTPDYFSTLGMELLRGRFITAQDGAASLPVMVVNHTLAERYFSGQDPLGQKIQLGKDDKTLWTVVGVVKDVVINNFATNLPAQSYVPFAQAPSRAAAIVVRTAGDPTSLVAAMRDSVALLDRDQPIAEFATMSELVDRQEAPHRIFTQFSTCFGLVALFLAAIGIYGVMAYVVAGRTREMGIRMALGARPGDVMRLILSHGLRLTIVGLFIGLAGAGGLAQLMSGLLFGVDASDPVIFIGAAMVLGAAIMFASYLPARRAARVDPLVALRYE